jgi:hypothetical protein
MQIIKKIKPANVVNKDSMIHILGGSNTNGSTNCSCSGSGDNNNNATSCRCIS